MISAYSIIHHGDTEKNKRYLRVSVPPWLVVLTGMADVHDIAILDDVVLALKAESTLGAGVGFGTGLEQLIPADGFRPDEMLFEIGMDRACCLLGAGMRGDLP